MALPTVLYLFPENTQVVQIQGLQDIITGLYLDAATVSATLFDSRGNPDAILNGITMSYLVGSNGNYQGTVPSTFNPTLGGGYKLQITAVQSSVQSVFTIDTIIKLRNQ